MTRRRPVAVAAFALLAGCAFHRQQVAAPNAEHALPDRNPVTRATVQAPLEQSQIDQVSMKAAVFDARPGAFWTGWEWRDVVRPALGPAEALEVRRAFPECIWQPAVGPNGEPTQATVGLAIQRQEPPPAAGTPAR